MRTFGNRCDVCAQIQSFMEIDPKGLLMMCLSIRARGRSMADSFFFFLFFPGVESQQSGFSTQSWIIGTMCAVVLLVLIALMACFVRRNIGGKYAGTPPPPQRQEMFSMEKGQSVFGQRLALFTSIRTPNECISHWRRHFCMTLIDLLKAVRCAAVLSFDPKCARMHADACSDHKPSPLTASLDFLHVPIYPPPYPISNLHVQISLFPTANISF